MTETYYVDIERDADIAGEGPANLPGWDDLDYLAQQDVRDQWLAEVTALIQAEAERRGVVVDVTTDASEIPGRPTGMSYDDWSDRCDREYEVVGDIELASGDWRGIAERLIRAALGKVI